MVNVITIIRNLNILSDANPRLKGDTPFLPIKTIRIILR